MPTFWPRLAILALLSALAGTAGQVTPAAAQIPAQTPAQTPAQSTPQAGATAEEFGVEITLPEQTIIYMAGSGTWDSAYDTLVEALRMVHGFLDKRGLKPDGDAMMIFTDVNDAGFDFRAAVPLMGPIDNPPQGDLAVGTSPSGKAYKFTHRGPYDTMENLYEAITNFFDEKDLQPADIFIERYVTDPRTTPENELVIEVIFPVLDAQPDAQPDAEPDPEKKL